MNYIPEEVTSDSRFMRYRRRVLRLHDNKEASPRVRHIRLLNGLGAICIATFTVLFADFGPETHCFSPIRNFYNEQKRKFFSLTDKDREEITIRKSI